MGKAKGHYFYPGRACHFVSTDQGCTIYDDRPKLCRIFECAWLTDPTVPEELKPDNSNLIILPGSAPMALPIYGQEVSAEHQAMYDKWAIASLDRNQNMGTI